METVLLAIAALAAIAAAIGAWRPAPAPPRDEALHAALEAQTRRFGEDIERLRAAVESLSRETIAAQSNAQRDATVQLLARLDEVSATTRRELGESLQASRRSQDDRLDRTEAALRSLGEALATTTASLDARLIEFGKLQAEASAALATSLQERHAESAAIARKELSEALGQLRQSGEAAREAQGVAFQSLQDRVGARLEELRTGNEAKLEAIRETVAEKLQTTLEARLGESFRLVSERLEMVQRGLGEMQSLASGVGDLKKVLSNVRARGTFGEVQLAALLEQVLNPGQYDENVAVRPGATERVEFAIRLPGRDGSGGIVHLPIDAKFPQEDYLRLVDAYEAGNKEGVEEQRRNLRVRLLAEADSIAKKYIAVPHTTDFAILFLPTEGLYAEALRLRGLIDDMQSRRVILAGPSTLFAILSSLQMGFRTLAIEQRSSEVWRVLGAVKTEFAKFGETLQAVRKSLDAASNKIGAVEQRHRVMKTRLRSVEELDDAGATKELPFTTEGDEE